MSDSTICPDREVVLDQIKSIREKRSCLNEEIEQSVRKMEEYTKESNFQILLKELLEELVVNKPDDPVEHLIQYLEGKSDS